MFGGIPTRRRSSGGGMGRLAIAAVLAIFSLITYFSSSAKNPITGEDQHINISVDQEIALGLEAAPEMAAQHGGLDPDPQAQAVVDEVGNRVLTQSAASRSPYPFEFHLLEDPQTVNAFALPGGQVFITRALFDKLRSEAELAGVLGHEIGHVIGRHSAEHIAKQQLTQGLTGAAVIAAYDPNNPSSAQRAAMAAMIGQLINLKFGRDDELESDYFGVCFLEQSGYDPLAMQGVMEVLASASQGGAPPEFFSTHPNPENRIERIQAAAQNTSSCPR